jgi:hypothetical protein
LQFVSDQELEGAVEADVRQSGILLTQAFKLRGPKTKKSEVSFFVDRAGQATKCACAGEKILRIGR